MLSSLFCYAEPLGFLASKGYKITCTKTDLILPCGGFDLEYNDTPFARVILSHALKGIEQGMAPCLVDPGALADAVSCYVKELGKIGYEADLAAVELFCSDEVAKSDGLPHEDLFLVEAPPSRIDDHVVFDDEGKVTFFGLDTKEPFYKVFDVSEIQKVIPCNTFKKYLAKERLFYWDDGDFVFASNTKSSLYGCPPNLKHLGLELTKRERSAGKTADKLATNTTWEKAFDEFENCPTADVLELLTKSVVIRKGFLDLRKENGPINGVVLMGFRNRFNGAGRAVSFNELVEALRAQSESVVMRFMLFMELRGLLVWSFGACHYE